MTKVFIGVGHGGLDSGAVSGSFIERDINLIMALACANYLETAGVNVKLSRYNNVDTDKVAQEVAECKAYNPNLAIEIHNNAGGGNGFEIYTNGKTDSLRLAEMINKEVLNMGQNSRGIKYRNNLAWTKMQGFPVVLCEGFFLDNAEDRKIADTIEEQQKFGVTYANAILKYLGIPIPKDTTITILVNEKPVEVTACKVGNNNYIKLRDLPKIVSCDVGYSEEKRMPYVKF